MARSATRAKTLAEDYPIPQTREECDRAIKQFGDLSRDLVRLEADMNDEIAAIKHRYEKRTAGIKDKKDALFGGIKTWCSAYRNTITDHGKVKYCRFGSGEIKWRDRPPSVTVRGAEKVIEALKAAGLSRFIRTKEDVNKDAIKSDPAAVAEIRGISVKSAGEDFVVEPFEVELSEVGS